MNGTSYAGGGVLPNPGASWHAIGTGDFDGDGKADILWQNDNGSAGIWTMNGTSLTGSVSLPNPGAGWHLIGTDDFNGDGKSDILLRNADGTPQVWLMSPTGRHRRHAPQPHGQLAPEHGMRRADHLVGRSG
jgi:hypothetical protein